MDFSSKIQLYHEPPADFFPKVEVAACYLQIDNQVLLLQRTAKQSEPGKWGVPAGKLELGELKENAAKRELFEETGVCLTLPSQLSYLTSLFIRKPHIDYAYHMFEVHLQKTPSICLSDEHVHYCWIDWQEMEKIDLMDGALYSLNLYRKLTSPPSSSLEA